ncbi:hypothetical protein F5I97DRAFT_1844078 [Phlebopus sp. FC_14]|nr:hypothetical protein F5I97DRAFT_1844078 [Phlebopus sp. FC_14]
MADYGFDDLCSRVDTSSYASSQSSGSEDKSTSNIDGRNSLAQEVPSDSSPIFRNNSCFQPFAEDLNPLAETPRWQRDLDRQFTIIFKNSVLSDYCIDEMAIRTLQIIGSPTKLKMRGLAMACFLHWTRLQFDLGNPNACADKVTFLINRISHHLVSISDRARQDFQDELSSLCVEKLYLTWCWLVEAGTQLPLPHENILPRVVANIVMFGHLFRAGRVQHGTALRVLEHFSTFLPLPDAVAMIYMLLLQLGPTFANGSCWHFLYGLLANLMQLSIGRLPADPLCQLIFAAKRLVEEWQVIRTTLYHTGSPVLVLGENARIMPSLPCHVGRYPK